MNQTKILITEDEPVQALMLKRALEELGHKVIGVVNNGEESIALAKKEKPNLIMMDIGLPGGMDGITAADIIKKECDIPVIFVTASDDQATIKKAVASNANGYILKPINPREINIVVEMALTKDLLERKLKNLNKELDVKVKQRTKELQVANTDLKKALEKEKELNEFKSLIVTNVSHQFKTPLTTINSSAELIDKNIEMNGDLGRILKHSQRIQNSVKHLNDLLNEILYIDKADSVKISYNPEIINLQKYLETFFDDITHGICRKHNLKKSIELDQDEHYVDKELFHQVLSNLLANAANYSKDGTIIEVELKTENGWFYCTITDYGIGIPRKDQSKLFDRFFRGSNVGPKEGTGLGMAIIKKSLEVQGGELSFESEVGKGTTFHFKIPVATHTKFSPIDTL
jgi:signal transduction histidine kinase